MRNLKLSSLVWTLLVSTALGQQPTSYVDVSWPNVTGAGSPLLDARIHYPSVSTGPSSAIAPNPGGYPVVVFLHGFGMLGNDYASIGDLLASEGFVAVMLNTAQYSYVDMEHDARAVFPAIASANRAPGGFFEGSLAADRVGLLGHSMGGAVIAYVLNDDPSETSANPGYLCGLALAPVDPAVVGASTTVRVPIGLVSGEGDTLTPPSSHAVPYYASLQPSEGLKFHYQMGLSCDHMNIIGLASNDPSVYERTILITLGFFGQFLGGSLVGLDAVLGPEGQADPNLSNLEMDAAVPQSWASGDLAIGTQTRISVAAENGFSGLLAAQSTSNPMTTSYGPLLLDPSSAFSVVETYIAGERLDVMLTVPNSPVLVGTTFAVQGAGATIHSVFQLGSAVSFVIN